MRVHKLVDYADVLLTAVCLVWVVVLATSCASAPVSRAYHPEQGYCTHPGVMEGTTFPINETAEIDGGTLRFNNEDGTEQTELLGAVCVIKRKPSK